MAASSILQAQSELIKNIDRYYSDPISFVIEQIGANPEPEQAAFLSALAQNQYISVKSGHGIGKTAGESWAILWFMCTHPMAKVPCTAPTGHQLEDILWPEVGKWLNRSTFKAAFEFTKTKLWMKGFEEEWFAVPRSCSVPENLQGFHGDNVLFVIEEASGIPNEIMEVVEGALTNEGAYLLMVGNPTRISGTFHDSFHRDRALYKTFTFNAENSKLVSADYCRRIAGKFGIESDVYLVRVKGEFPKGNPDALIRLDEIEPAIAREVVATGILELGVDPARYGDDMSEICARIGNKCLGFREFSGINTTRLTGEIAKWVKELRNIYDYYDVDPKTEKKMMRIIKVKIDDTGIGGGVTDQLESVAVEIGIEPVPINFGGISNDPDYLNTAGEMWGNVKTLLPYLSLPDDDEMISQFTSRKYTLQKDGKIVLESKEHMKARGLVSPDKADALGLAFAPDNRPRWRPA